MLHTTTPNLRTNLSGRRFEIAAAAATAGGKFVFGDWLDVHLGYLVAAIVFWVTYVVLRRAATPSVIRRWGFTRTGLGESAVLTGGALAIGTAFCVVHAVVTGQGIVNWNLAITMALYPVWGLIQQFLLVAILADNVMALRRGRSAEFVVVMFSAFVFSAIHFPEIPLMIATFFLGAATTLIFFRTRNIWLIGVLHGWFASMFYYLVMHVDPLEPLLAVAFGR